PRGGDVAGITQHELPLAVVAEPARLQHGRQADPFDRDLQFVAAVDGRERRRVEAYRSEQSLLDEAVLRHRQRLRIRENARMGGKPLRGFGWHVLEIEGRYVDAPGKLFERGEIAPV